MSFFQGSFRRALFTLLAVVGALGLAGSVSAKQDLVAYDRVVYPTGQFPLDVDNVQAAVDLGGTVLLKATNLSGQPTSFNFGPADALTGGSVALDVAVAVFGEQVGTATTTVSGGVTPLIGGTPVQRRIQGILFDGPLWAAILISRSTGLDIVDNRITDVVGLSIPDGFPTQGHGIEVDGSNNPPENVTGHVRVSGNIIKDVHAVFSDGISLQGVVADISVRDNRVEGVQRSGIRGTDNWAKVAIEDNVIAPGPVQPTDQYVPGNGISVFDGVGASYLIRHNRINCENTEAHGIFLYGYDAPYAHDSLVEANEIQMDGSSSSGISLVGRIAAALVRQNRITGTGAVALNAISYSTLPLRGNVFQANDTKGFAAGVATVFLDEFTSDSIVVGSSGTVIDLGYNNHATGLTPMGDASAGERIKAAMANKRKW